MQESLTGDMLVDALNSPIVAACVRAPAQEESRPAGAGDPRFEAKAKVVGVDRLLGRVTSDQRKEYPLCTGLLDYFPDALAEVARISFKGNQKHNPGQPLHWARGKSMDHPDCVMRHLQERGGLDPEGNRHSAQLVWRALAILQEELEAEKGLACPRGATPLPPR